MRVCIDLCKRAIGVVGSYNLGVTCVRRPSAGRSIASRGVELQRHDDHAWMPVPVSVSNSTPTTAVADRQAVEGQRRPFAKNLRSRSSGQMLITLSADTQPGWATATP